MNCIIIGFNELSSEHVLIVGMSSTVNINGVIMLFAIYLPFSHKKGLMGSAPYIRLKRGGLTFEEAVLCITKHSSSAYSA